jgi:SEC-C motif
MSRTRKVNRNDPCPCLSGKKFKSCCFGKVDWEAIFRDGRDERPHLSLRGRNLYFTARIADALQLGAPGRPRGLKGFKAAFTADAVRKIYEAVMDAWPPDTDISHVLKRPPGDVSGLYIGDYSAGYLTRGIVRHSIYANKILLIDPFIYPASVRDEYNPILNPEQHRGQTLKNVNLWLGLLPWIEEGIVEIIRPPSDFDRALNWKFMTDQQKKFEENAELKKASEASVEELGDRHIDKLKFQQFLLGAPDSYLRRRFEEGGIAKDGGTVDQFMEYVREERERDPDFLEPLDKTAEGQLFTISSGTSYPSAVMTAGITGSYLFTDLYVKWREMELDRESHSAENKVWAPFAKAVQNAPLRYLNNLRLDHALTLRKEGRLESLRGFLHKVWRDASTESQFASENAVLLAEELGARVREAEQEWKQIDTDLLRIVGAAAMGGLLAAGPLIAAGHASFLAAAATVAGAAPLISSARQRHSFPDKFPAAFFMKIDKAEDDS